MIGLTTKQSDLLAYLRRYLESTGGVAPSFNEMMLAMGFTSKSSVHRLLGMLEDRGHIRRLPHQARAIEIVDVGPLHRIETAELVAELARRGIAVIHQGEA